MMSKFTIAAAMALTAAGASHAQQPQSTTAVPAPSASSGQLTHFYINNYYKQNVYDSSGTKIAEVADALVGADGKIDGFVLSVRGGEKRVAVPFDAVKSSQESGRMRLTLNITKDQLEPAPAFRFDDAFAQQNQHTVTGLARLGETTVFATIPTGTTTVTNWYKQNVYDPTDVKIGEISDVIVDNEGNIRAFIIGVGGFLGIGEKDVAVPFNSVGASQRDGKWWLTMNVSKDALKSAPGYKYDKDKATWVPA
jgi:sporulation protein YlmC with PRC-barrel domain